LAVAPALNDRISHGVDISSQGAGKPLHCIEAGLMHVRQPDSELRGILASKNAAESRGEPTHRGKFRPFTFATIACANSLVSQITATSSVSVESHDNNERSTEITISPITQQTIAFSAEMGGIILD